ncbi:MAG: diaminopimelate epimerase [Elusimicrobiota bacterium]|nr:diaminopimelate epimerase [Elusimicrobiota bacterium]
MNISFTKMSGSGNDFIVIDNRNKIVKTASAFAKKYCNREGVDGLLLVEKSHFRHTDFKMVYYNSDGSHASFCGNGARCISLFAYLNKMAPSKMSFESDAGIILAEIKNCSRKAKLCYDVKIKMPAPKNFKLDFDLIASGKNFEASFANTGVPHTVIFVKDIKNVDVNKLGRLIRFHKKFQPAGTNVNFVKVLGKNKLQVRTYERGVEAETLACGTGVVASAIISIMKKYVSSPVSVLTQGGETLKVYYDGKTAFFEGKVTVIFEGKIEK